MTFGFLFILTCTSPSDGLVVSPTDAGLSLVGVLHLASSLLPADALLVGLTVALLLAYVSLDFPADEVVLGLLDPDLDCALDLEVGLLSFGVFCEGVAGALLSEDFLEELLLLPGGFVWEGCLDSGVGCVVFFALSGLGCLLLLK